MHCPLLASSVLLAFVAISGTISAQNQPTQSVVPSPDLTADYPLDRAGIFIQGMSWQEIKGTDALQEPGRSRNCGLSVVRFGSSQDCG